MLCENDQNTNGGKKKNIRGQNSCVYPELPIRRSSRPEEGSSVSICVYRVAFLHTLNLVFNISSCLSKSQNLLGAEAETAVLQTWGREEIKLWPARQ